MADWFADWFDSEYYHLLYAHRDETEARRFLEDLVAKLTPSSDAVMLDLACGKGRHTRTLAAMGYRVIGVDLSPSSILHAQQFETEKLQFFTHDMRLTFRPEYFDYIFNFFTSFGYFEHDDDHAKAIDSIAQSLKANGVFLIDYLNSPRVASQLVFHNELTRDGVHFDMRRALLGGYFVKDITITDGETVMSHQERVRAFELEDLTLMITDAGMVIEAVYGDYDLSSYQETTSARMIIQARKTA